MENLSLPCPFLNNVHLSEKTYYQIGGKARFFALPESVRHIGDLLCWNRIHQFPLALMGMGSNTLFSSEPFEGIVISFENMNRMFWISEHELFCEAGVENGAISEELLNKERGGGEWLYRLPGQIGSTVRMNARCFGGEIADVTSGIMTASISGALRWHRPDEVFLGYKNTSIMDRSEIVVAVVLSFSAVKKHDEIQDLMESFEKERFDKHHFDYPSCGSTFKNNYEVGQSSGRIFEALGFKGVREGGAQVSPYHANFIYNTGGATSSDVLRLAAKMKTVAATAIPAKLDLEVQCIGLHPKILLEACGVPFVPDRVDDEMGWAGMFWLPHAEEAKSTLHDHHPELLLYGPLTNYSDESLSFPGGLFVSVEQLLSLDDAVCDPEQPFLRWSTIAVDASVFARLPGAAIGDNGFTDELWQYSVSELFLGHGEAEKEYVEFEMTPDGGWVALKFSHRRKRANGFEIPVQEPWERHTTRFHDPNRFGMTFSYSLLEPFIVDRTLAMQCAASIGESRYGLFPWWKSPIGTPDFHQPDRYYRVQLG
ncbi:MAG: UDP-N-acetylmuramate dehydrogenase [Chlorobium sp.]|jgi:UDP-N-acetylmuramate dehydrogenase|nr:UDP-N-acetylmuramate dehydrogenase [Chlorobium sp.]